MEIANGLELLWEYMEALEIGEDVGKRVMFMFNGTEFLKYRQVCGNRHVGRVGKCSGLKRRRGK